MAELIDRYEAINAICGIGCGTNTMCAAPCGEVQAILELSSIKAESVQHGHWVYGEDEDGVDGYRCNKCGFFVTWDYKHNHIHFIDDYLFCPHCNARMDEVE